MIHPTRFYYSLVNFFVNYHRNVLFFKGFGRYLIDTKILFFGTPLQSVVLMSLVSRIDDEVSVWQEVVSRRICCFQLHSWCQLIKNAISLFFALLLALLLLLLCPFMLLFMLLSGLSEGSQALFLFPLLLFSLTSLGIMAALTTIFLSLDPIFLSFTFLIKLVTDGFLALVLLPTLHIGLLVLSFLLFTDKIFLKAPFTVFMHLFLCFLRSFSSLVLRIIVLVSICAIMALLMMFPNVPTLVKVF